jgi:hypothetical protein
MCRATDDTPRREASAFEEGVHERPISQKRCQMILAVWAVAVIPISDFKKA